MNDLISRKALIEEYDRVHIGPPGGARKLIEDAPAVREWIPISDRLPTKEDANEYGYVLVCSKGVGVVEDMEWDHVDSFKDLLRCWMPIPAPPKEDE